MKYPIKLFNNSELLSLSSDHLVDFNFLNATQYGLSLEIKLRAKYEKSLEYRMSSKEIQYK